VILRHETTAFLSNLQRNLGIDEEILGISMLWHIMEVDVTVESAHRLARYLAKELSLDEEKTDVLRFGAESVLSTLLAALAVVITAWLLGCLPETLVALGAYAVVRNFAGGAHCSTPWRCSASSALIFPALGKSAVVLSPHMPGSELYFVLVAGVVTLCLTAKLAPVDNPVNPIRDPERRLRLKRYSILAVLSVSVVLVGLLQVFSSPTLVPAGALGLVCSAFVLTRPAHLLTDALDRVMGYGAAVLGGVAKERG
jgi:accessory gene regulator B